MIFISVWNHAVLGSYMKPGKSSKSPQIWSLRVCVNNLTVKAKHKENKQKYHVYSTKSCICQDMCLMSASGSFIGWESSTFWISLANLTLVTNHELAAGDLWEQPCCGITVSYNTHTRVILDDNFNLIF